MCRLCWECKTKRMICRVCEKMNAHKTRERRKRTGKQGRQRKKEKEASCARVSDNKRSRTIEKRKRKKKNIERKREKWKRAIYFKIKRWNKIRSNLVSLMTELHFVSKSSKLKIKLKSCVWWFGTEIGHFTWSIWTNLSLPIVAFKTRIETFWQRYLWDFCNHQVESKPEIKSFEILFITISINV